MGWGKGKPIVKGSDVCMDISHWSKSQGAVPSGACKRFLGVDGEIEVDEDYKVFLLELQAFIDQEYENEVSDDAQEEEDYDPHYKLFFENLKPHGHAYVLEIATNNGNKIIKYEYEGEDKYQSPGDAGRKSQYSQRKPLKKNRHHFGVKDVDSSDQKVKAGTRNEKINEDYYMFLRHLSIVEESFVFEDKDGNRIRYEESGDESSSDSDAKRSAKLPRVGSEKTPSTRKKTLGLRDKMPPLNRKSIVRSSSGFRRGVMEVFQKPYDRNEHMHLLKEAEKRKPIRRYRLTRNNISPYSINELGKSYLDHHVDLKNKINAAKRDGSSCEVLYRLRGLFFYLVHAADDGSFPPWRDQMWLEEMKRKLQDRF